MKQTTDQRANENDDFLLSSSIISKTKGNGTRSTVNDQSKSRENDIDLILMNNNKTQMKNASDDKRTDKDSKPSTKRIIGIYDDLFLPEKVHTEDYKNEDEDASHGDDEAPKKISQESSPRNINEDDDFDEIPTIDSLHSSTNDKCEIIYDFNLRIAQLPSLQELVRMVYVNHMSMLYLLMIIASFPFVC